jgi:Domain of unknown function (DUF4124)
MLRGANESNPNLLREVVTMRAAKARIAARSCLVAGLLCVSGSEAAMFKCTAANGTVGYQDFPCEPGSTEKSIKVSAPPPPVSTQGNRSIYMAPVPRSMYESAANPKIPKSIDAKGALETWDRFGKAFNRGDKDAAMKELTPSAQQKYGPVFDTLMPPAGGAAPKK